MSDKVVRSRYAGIYIPMLMQEIARQGLITNVEGAAIGNGCCERAYCIRNVMSAYSYSWLIRFPALIRTRIP